MREIKFRVWSNTRKKYHYLALNELCNNIGLIQIPNNVLSFVELIESGMEPEQFTGRHDKNGKEIYDGDILSNKSYKFIVLWVNVYSSFMVKNISEPWPPQKIDRFIDTLEIIGNIRKNPELLK